MTWKRLFRWFLRAALVCLAGVLCAVGVAWYIISIARKERWLVSQEGRIATALGWEHTDDIEERLRAQPVIVLSLLEHDSSRVRQAAQRFLSVANPKLDEGTLNALVAEIHDRDSTKDEYLVKLLAIQGPSGARRIADFYRGKEAAAKALQRLIEGAVEYPLGHSRDDLIHALATVVCDESVTISNRCQAATALGYMGMPNTRYEPHDGRFAVIAALRGATRSLPQPVATAVTAALRRIETEEARKETMRAPQDDTRDFRNLSAEGTEAITALSDRNDWRRVGEAADALAFHGITQAIPALEEVAASHWYRPVRRTAQRAVRVLQGRESCLPAVDEQGRSKVPLMDFRWQMECEIAEWRNGPHHNRNGDDSWSSGQNLRRLLRASYGYLLPRVREFEYRRPGRLPKRLAFEDCILGRPWPEYAINFGGGTLLSYNAGEWGCGLVYCQKGRIPQLLAPASATDFIQMPFGLLILSFEGGLMVATENADGSVDIAPFPKHLPIGFGEVSVPQRLPNGELKAECIGADVYITPTGDVRYVGRSED